MEGYWIFIVFALLLLVVWGSRVYLMNRRTQAIASMAPELGLKFLGSDRSLVPAAAWGFQLFSQGRSQQVQNVLSGRIGSAAIWLFDYSFRSGSGKNSSTRRYMVAFIEADDLNLPEFHLKPENILHRVRDLFGSPDIDFDHEPEFSDAYLLDGLDERRIRQVFNHRIISFYNTHPRTSTEAMDNLMLYYVSGQRPAEQWSNFLAAAREAVDLFRGVSHSL